MSLVSKYVPTSEDYIFIYQLYEKDGNPLPGMELFFRNWFYWNDDLKLNGKNLNQESIKEFIDNGCINAPEIDFKNEIFWSFLYSKDKNFVFKLCQYFKPKGFDIMDELSKFIALNYSQNSYMIWCLFPLYISCLNKKQLAYSPNPTNLFTTLNWLSNNKKKYSCNAFLELISYASKFPEKYNVNNLIEVFAKFTENQKSIPKKQIKKYENLLNKLENLAQDYWEIVVNSHPELKIRLNKQNTTHYDVQDYIARRWSFDVHNLSIKNGGFNVKLMKDTFHRMHEVVKEYFSKISSVYELGYQNNDAIIIINISTENSDIGKDNIAKLQKIIDILYGHCLRNNIINLNEIKNFWNNLLLAQGLDKSLIKNEKNIRKVVKI